MTVMATAASASTAPAAATIFLVPPRADRLTLGRRLVAPLLGDRPQDHALALRGVHPDVMELLRAGGKEKIGIDQVREVLRMAQFSAVQASRKACLIPFAEDLTPEASNALLKVLEEPTRGMVFVLLASHTGDLLPTIVSRSRVERVQPERKASLVERLVAAGYTNSEADWLVRVADRAGELDELAAARVRVDEARAQARSRLETLSAADLVATCLDGGAIERREAHLVLAARATARDPELLTSGVLALAGQERSTLFVFLTDLLSACADTIRGSVAADANDAASAPRGGGRATDGRPAADAVAGKLSAIRARELPLQGLERACVAIETANRALLAYSPAEAVLLSLFFAFGGRSHDQ
ncbi:MAG: hypothetical protein NTX69_04915 [Candidatus Bipolaricaulota bacterium]|nr:hypothetical protein [Candidatus Bipolaricaulota bacterium]